jgi:hypothetical protein
MQSHGQWRVPLLLTFLSTLLLATGLDPNAEPLGDSFRNLVVLTPTLSH